ncbi:hypothetical protein BJ912DRAFT_316136 [Pholiota molesta]|nr:hypothetical protein BJ912DRAFT_316136 [Pholiota molesta]
MLSNFLSRLKSLFRAMNSSSSNEHPSTGTSDTQSQSKFIPKMGAVLPVKAFMTETIVDKLENGHVKLEDGHVNSAWEDLSKHFVSKLVYYKRQGKDNKAEHEYLVAYIVDDKQKTSRLLIERRPSESGQPAVGKNGPAKTTHSLLKSLRALRSEGASSSDATPILRRTPPAANGLASSSRSVTSFKSTVASSVPTSSQDSLSKSGEADDVVRGLRPEEEVAGRVLRVFEPEGRNLSFLHFCIIVEDVHDQEPDYKLFRSQCYWFAMMVMGISMLQGGHVQIYEKLSKNRHAKPYCATLQAYTTTNREIPNDLDQGLPIPSILSPSEEDIREITKVGSAGTIQSITYGLFEVRVISVSFNAIWEAGRESQDHYNILFEELGLVQNFFVAQTRQYKERAERAEAEAQRANERAARSEAEAQQAKAELERLHKSVSRRRLDSVASVVSILPSTSEL